MNTHNQTAGILLTDVDTNIMNQDEFTYSQVLLVKGYLQRVCDLLGFKKKTFTINLNDIFVFIDEIEVGFLSVNGKKVRNDLVNLSILKVLDEIAEYVRLVNDELEDDESYMIDVTIICNTDNKGYLTEVSAEVDYIDQEEDEEDAEDEDEDLEDAEDEDEDLEDK
jgi:hypothetical protein